MVEKLEMMRSDVDSVAEEHEGRCGRVAGDPSTPEPLVAVNAKQRERELHLVPSPHSLPHPLRVSESTQHRSHAHHVQPLVPAQRHHHRLHRRRWRRRHVAEAQVLPQRVVVAREAAPQPTHARRHAQRGTVEAFKDFPENVNVVVYEEPWSFLLLYAVLLLLHHSCGLRHREKKRKRKRDRDLSS